jgi:hypothetical protein
MSDPNDAIQSLARIAAASARLMALEHMRANLDHVAAEVSR